MKFTVCSKIYIFMYVQSFIPECEILMKEKMQEYSLLFIRITYVIN